MYRSIISAFSCLGLAACGGTTTGGGVAGAQSGGGFAISNSAPAPQLPPPSILGGSLTPTAGSNTGSVTLAQGGGYTYQQRTQLLGVALRTRHIAAVTQKTDQCIQYFPVPRMPDFTTFVFYYFIIFIF